MNNKEIDEFLDQVGDVLESVPEQMPKDAMDQLFKSMIGGAGIRLLGEIVKRLPEMPAPAAVVDEPAMPPAPAPYNAERKLLQKPAGYIYYRLKSVLVDVSALDPAAPLGFANKKKISDALNDIRLDADILFSILSPDKDEA